ncbi:MAG TPA: hypothetical protein VF778_04350 [Xanthobacteraceae bacterium]
MPKLLNLDPLKINERLYKQVGELLTQLETGKHVTMRERVQALVAIGRVQVIFMGLRKENADEPAAGSTVRKYATAFEKNDPRGRKKASRSAKSAEPASDWFEHAAIAADDTDNDPDAA